MKITRTMTIETNDIQIGDRIQVGHYTATCQKLPEEGLALFFLDQYLDKAMQMNKKNTTSSRPWSWCPSRTATCSACPSTARCSGTTTGTTPAPWSLTTASSGL